MNTLKNFAIRKYGFKDEELKTKLQRYYTSEPITAITLLRMIYSLENNSNQNATDKAIWEFAIARGLLSDIDIIGIYDTISMKDMYVIVVNYFENTMN